MPWKGLLEGLGEIEETPADDDIVVESHEEAHLQNRQEKPVSFRHTKPKTENTYFYPIY